MIAESHKLKVYLVSPTTLMATLTTVRAILRDVEMRAQASVIQTEVGVLLKDIGRLVDRLAIAKHPITGQVGANIGAAGTMVFYDALLPHVARGDEVDRLSTSAYALGYLGGGLLLAAQLALMTSIV